MTTFHLSAAQIKAVASLAAVAGKGGEAQILHSIRVDVTPETVTAFASDRKIAARLAFPLGGTAHTLSNEGASLLLSTADAATIAKLKSGGYFTFESDPAKAQRVVTFEADDRAPDEGGIALTAHDGNYPPIERLYPADDAEKHGLPAGVGINPAQLAKLAKLTLPGETDKARREAAYWLTCPIEHDGERIRKPIIAERGNGPAVLTVLIQPNVRLS